MSSLNGPWGCHAKRVCVVDTQVLGQCIRGACIAGKPGSYRDLRRALLFCWSWLACDGVSAVSVRARRLHRGQARLLQGSAQGTAFSVGAGLPAMALAGCQYVRGACIAGKPGSYRDLRRALLFCWSRLACDGVSAVSVRARRLNRGQARLLQRSAQGTAFLLEQACLRWRQRGVSTCAASASRASPAPTEICAEHCLSVGEACLRWRRRGVSTCVATASRASPAPKGIRAEHCFFCWSRLACDGVNAVSVNTRRLHRGQARLLQGSAQGTAFSVGAGLPAMASTRCQ
ncbi:hypothetical protein AB7M23_003897 [Pseudomonas sp. HLS-6 TE3448]